MIICFICSRYVSKTGTKQSSNADQILAPVGPCNDDHTAVTYDMGGKLLLILKAPSYECTSIYKV